MNALFHASGTPRQSGVRAANAALQQAGKITPLTPADGVDSRSIAPTPGVESLSTAPEDGAIRGCFGHLSIPGGGDHLEKPSVPEFKPRTQRKLNAIQHAGCSTELKRKQLVLFTGGAVLCLMASKQRHLTPEKHKTREGRCHHLQAGSYQVQCLLTGASAPSLYGYGRNGQKGNLLRTSTGVFFTSHPPNTLKTQNVLVLGSPDAIQTMIAITKAIRSTLTHHHTRTQSHSTAFLRAPRSKHSCVLPAPAQCKCGWRTLQGHSSPVRTTGLPLILECSAMYTFNNSVRIAVHAALCLNLTTVDCGVVCDGKFPEDVIAPSQVAEQRQSWPKNLFNCIASDPDSGLRAKRLAEMGVYVASDVAELANCAHTDMLKAIKEGCAA